MALAIFPHIDMATNHIENEVKSFLDKCFLKVGNNIIYSTLVIARLLYNLWQWFRIIAVGITLRKFVKLALKLLEGRIEADKPPPLASMKLGNVLLSAS